MARGILSGATFGAPKGQPAYVPGCISVRIKPDAVRPHLPAAAVAPGRGARGVRARALAKDLPESVAGPLEHLTRNAGLTLRPLFEEAKSSTARARADLPRAQRARHALATSVADPDDDELAGLAMAQLPDARSTKRAIKELCGAPGIDFAAPVAARWLLARKRKVKSDPQRNVQWGLHAIRWFEAPDAEADLNIGVMDTGIDMGHPDLDGGSIDYDPQGVKPADVAGHGTHVAGIIGAVANNDIGITGVARCRLSVWKIFQDTPDADGNFLIDPDLYAKALGAASQKGLQALNLSIGGSARDPVEELLIAKLLRGGVSVVGAMGNEYEEGDPIEYPGAFEGVISVGAIAEDRRRASFSNTGKHIDVVAPGKNILSTLPTKKSLFRDESEYASWDGTSMATPHVAAAAAMIARANPQFGPEDVRERLRKTTMPLKAMGKRKWTREYGTGLLDMAAAVS